MTPDAVDPGYPEENAGKLQLIWGDGFLSPGGPAEIARILGQHDVAGLRVLDIGSGAGGADVVLVRDHGARRVTGIDVDPGLVELAAARARKLRLDDRIEYRLVRPGTLPFPDDSFDAVFSKDAIIHVGDKAVLYAEIFRTLRPGGRLLVGDWLRSDDDALQPLVDEFVAASGHDFTMVSLSWVASLVSRLGFAHVELEDRHAWYAAEAAMELDRLRGPLGAEIARRWGEESAQSEVAFWEVLVRALASGALRPAHVRALKPHHAP
ncbi:MAG: methyltransferase domain-containing protein [Gemmatimonadales bacterium]|nr:MAG: methyltransferase domain-containing protein [Gemmatimonadales bacterium]